MEPNTDARKKGDTPQLHTLPLELQAMIITSMTPQHFRKAFFTCRLVCRRFKEATDLAFRNQFVARLSFVTFLDGITKLRNDDLLSDFDGIIIQHDLGFVSFSEDNTQANFSKRPYSKNNNPAEDILIGDNVEICFGPYILQSAMVFDFPYMDHTKFDPEKMELGIPWVRLLACLLPKQIAFGEHLKLAACQDLEATRWTISNPSAEQGLRIALRSDITRRERFESCVKIAYTGFLLEFPKESTRKLNTYSYSMDPDRLDWYLEWAGYVGISLTGH